MTSRIGNQRISAGSDARFRGFTLIELILVMALLVIVLSVASPSLARFFRGRNLESEARRFLSLTRYGQNLAVTEGMPYLLWMDEATRDGNPPGQWYGLRAETSGDDYEDEEEPKPLEYQLARDLHLEVELQVPGMGLAMINTLLPSSGLLYTPRKPNPQLVGNLPTIRFTPDGFISETSPQAIGFREGEEKRTDQDAVIWIGLSRTRLNYEIWTNPPSILRR